MLSNKIKIFATIYTVLLMASVVYVLVFAGFEIKSPVVKGKVIQATMVDISQLQSNNKAKEVKKQPQPKKEEPKKEEPKKEEPKKEEPKKQEPKKEELKKEEPKKEEIKPVEPVKKDPPRIIKEEPVVDTAAQELERQKDLERKKKLDEIRKKRIAAEERTKREEQNFDDLINKVKDAEIETVPEATQNSSTVRGQSDADKELQLMTQYQLAVISSVERQWNKPASANENLLCHVKVRQIPGGGVIDATISTPCNANTIVKNSIIAAIKKAEPLPYKGFESVFSRSATFIFQPAND